MAEIEHHTPVKNKWLRFLRPVLARVVTKPPRLSLLGWWVLAYIVGGVVGGYLAQTVTGFRGGEPYDPNVLQQDGYRIQALYALTIGLSVGLFGWLAMRLYFSLSFWWVLATGFGWAIAFVVAYYLGEGFYEALEAQTYPRMGDVALRLADILFGAIVGSLIGFLQCAAFKRRLARVEFWILANAASWIIIWVIMTPMIRLASPLIDISGEVSQTERMLRWSLAGVWLFAILGLVTGATLLWLLRRPVPAATNVEANRNLKT